MDINDERFELVSNADRLGLFETMWIIDDDSRSVFDNFNDFIEGGQALQKLYAEYT